MLIGVQGFGRIGRTLLRVLWARGDADRITQIIDPAYSVPALCYGIEFDTNYGRFPGTVEQVKDGAILRDQRRAWRIAFNAGHQLQDFDSGLDAVVCATGRLNETPAAAPRLFLTFRSDRAQSECVLGLGGGPSPVGRIISCSTCDAIAVAPVLEAIDSVTRLERIAVTTLHPWLSHQRLVDGPAGDPRSLLQLGRGAPGALIPKPTSLGETVAALLPNLLPRVRCTSFRVPTATVCFAQVYALSRTTFSRKRALQALERKYPIVRIEHKPLVSSDLVGEAASAVVLEPLVSVDDKEIQLTIAYDNEWGYCARVADVLALHASDPALMPEI